MFLSSTRLLLKWFLVCRKFCCGKNDIKLLEAAKSRILVVITTIVGPGALRTKILLTRVGSKTVRMEIGTDRSCVYTVPAVSEYSPFLSCVNTLIIISILLVHTGADKSWTQNYLNSFWSDPLSKGPKLLEDVYSDNVHVLKTICFAVHGLDIVDYSVSCKFNYAEPDCVIIEKT